jgi:hypothetical protein
LSKIFMKRAIHHLAREMQIHDNASGN